MTETTPPDQAAQGVEDCWIYVGYKDNGGYGRLSVVDNGIKKNYGAHRVMYENEISRIPEGLELDHLCKTRCCINPLHLEPVTHKINNQRRYGIDLCKRGHQLTPENSLVFAGRKGRQCKTCKVNNERAYKAKTKLERQAAAKHYGQIRGES